MDLSKKEWTKYLLLNYKTIPDILFRQIRDNVDWDFLNSQNLPCAFISKFLFELDIREVCRNSYLSDEFIIQQKDWLDWSVITETRGTSLSQQIREKCRNNILAVYTSNMPFIEPGVVTDTDYITDNQEEDD
jgi:hypothetical protein